MVKKTKRKAFSFLRSYFDVINELEKDEDKLDFLMAILNKQFLNEDPDNLNFVPKLCYESQRHAIESSVKGWLRVTKTDLQGNPMTNPPTPLPTNPQTNPKEEEEEEKDKEEVKEKKINKKKIDLDVIDLDVKCKDLLLYWISYRRDINKPIKAQVTLLLLAKKIKNKGFEVSSKVINNSIENNYQGLFWDNVKENKTKPNRNIAF
jgi:hypothetical protein